MPRLPAQAGLIALVVLAAGCAHAPVGPTRTELAYSLPSQSVTVPFKPGAQEGRVLVVSYFTTWCFPCLAELPVLEKLHREREAQGLTVVLVGLDLEGAKVLRPFSENEKLSMPVLVADERIRTGASPLGPLRELPAKVIFGRDGKVIAGFSGVADPKALLELVERALK